MYPAGHRAYRDDMPTVPRDYIARAAAGLANLARRRQRDQSSCYKYTRRSISTVELSSVALRYAIQFDLLPNKTDSLDKEANFKKIP